MPESIDIGTRRELLIDDYLIDKIVGARLVLHKPVAREVAIVCDAPWEGNTCCYPTVFRDGDLYRMYYRGSHFDENTEKMSHQVVCYAESRDGLSWTKPDLGIVEFEGSKQNSIVWDGLGSHNFAPFKDTNPDCKPSEQYKAIASKGDEGLYAFKSADAVDWSLMSDKPVITEGKFDSQNLAFWDPLRGLYVDFHRHFADEEGARVRDIMTCTSSDFLNWTEPEWLKYTGVPREHLYTNQVTPYHRAPHIYMGFPKRFVPTRSMADHRHAGVSDGVFMTSRDGVTFRRWGEAFIRPGLQPERWVNRNNMTAWGIVETESGVPGTPPELSIYSTESYYRGEACRLRRFTIRLDGFTSAQAPLGGGEVLTKLVRFEGTRLYLNMSTSAAGSLRVELQEADGAPIEGFNLAESEEIFGDEIERVATWKDGADLSALAGRPVRLRFVLRDADLFAFRFG